MSYAELGDVKARAGMLRDAWDDTTEVTDGDIERFLRDASATIDVAMAAHGYPAPATDDRVLAGLTPITADIALLMALTATWPGGNGGQAVEALRSEVRERVFGSDGKSGYVGGLRDGTLPILKLLGAGQDNPETGAAAFWSAEAGYSSWLDDLSTGAIRVDGSGLVIRSPIGPSIHRDSRF